MLNPREMTWGKGGAGRGVETSYQYPRSLDVVVVATCFSIHPYRQWFYADVFANILHRTMTLSHCIALHSKGADDALRGLFTLPFSWAGIVDAILATFGQNTRFIPMAVDAPHTGSDGGGGGGDGGGDGGGGGGNSGGGGNGGGEIIQVIVFDAQCTDVAAHLYYNPQTLKLKADSVCRQPAAAAAAAAALWQWWQWRQ